MFLENIIGNSSKVKILRTLSEINSGFSIEELENETGLSRGIIHREVKKLKKENILLEIQSKGKLKVYRLNLDNQYSQLITRLMDLEKVKDRQNKVLLKTWNILEFIAAFVRNKKININSIILFGSQAQGSAAVTSDIDLLFVSEDGEDQIYEICLHYSEKMGIKINPVIMSARTYQSELRKNTKFINEIKKGGIRVYGK